MISSGFKLLFVVIYLAIYFCNASNNAPKNKNEIEQIFKNKNEIEPPPCECGFVTDTPQTISFKDILTKTSDAWYAGTVDNVKLQLIKIFDQGGKYQQCITNALKRPGVDVLMRGNQDNFFGIDVLGRLVHFVV